ncbi:MAG TPA: LCP family protein [Candidatus Dorea intestinavium]|nr:LCP family protein [Candidatus Dorea intestinavium]
MASSLERRKRQERIRRKRKKRMIFMIVEIIILCTLSLVAFGMNKMGKLNRLDIDPTVTNKDLNLEDYTNIALFGLDAREGEESGVRSDSIIVASIDNKNKTIRLASVYRDTFLMQKDGTYFKANNAYAAGGPEEAVEMLNKNLDLNITEYASVNFKALADVVNLVGGIKIDLTLEEIGHLNNYSVETSKVTGLSYDPLPPEAGTYNLDGVQAVSYARIRYTAGGDFKRAERQRIVLSKIAEKVKKAGIFKLNKIIDKVLPEVTTSFNMSEILKMADYMISYDMGDNQGFPKEVATPDSIPGYKGSFAVPVNLEYNVKELHKFLFPDEAYTPSETVVSISNEIAYLTDIYVDEEEFTEDTQQEDTQQEDTQQENAQESTEDNEDLETGE